MKDKLSVTLIQANLQWESIAANLIMFSQKIETTPPTDLIVLPEMFSTGFSMNAAALAEDMNGSAVQWMKKTAAEKDCVVCGSLIIKEDEKYYNRLVWMRPGGEYEMYDKRHLFSLTTEPEIFTAGNERLIVDLQGWRVCPLVCYDLRFPVWARNSIQTEGGRPAYDLLLYVANWPERRSFAWKSLLTARAIENLAYVIGVNRVGDDANGIYYNGDSIVLDALGTALYTQEKDEAVFTVELSKSQLHKTREHLPFLSSADDFILNPKMKIKSH